MKLRCPGCLSPLAVDEGTYEEKVLVQCPRCLLVFLVRAEDEPPQTEEEPEPGEATILTSDRAQTGDPRLFQWNAAGASITVIEGDQQGMHLKLRGKELVAGRKGADLVLEDKAVSRTHFKLERREDGWWVADLGSTNGTYVNGEKITERRLRHLDEIMAGKTVILFAETEAEEERTPREETSPALDETKAEGEAKPEPPLPPGREFFLEFMSGKKKARSVKLEKTRVILGRGPEADLQIEDPAVSRKHALIEIHSRDMVYISDLASQNGVWLNGMRIRQTKLIHGDLIRIGNSILKFIVKDQP